MSNTKSFKITISNNITEKEGITYLLNKHLGYFKVDLDTKKRLLDMLEVPRNFLQSFDLIYISELSGSVFNSESLDTNLDKIQFIELKTTKKFLPENPKGFFFGATENEFKFAKLLKEKFRFCFVCLNKQSLSHSVLTLEELEAIIRSKRIQYQINL
jgi:hypothetical protein